MTVTDTTAEIAVVRDDTVSDRRTPWPSGRHRVKQPKPARAPLPAGTIAVLWVLTSIGLIAVWFVAYALLFSSVQQAASQRQLYAEFREQLALATAPLGGVITPGSPVAVMQAPDLGLTDQIVVEGTTSSVLRVGPGHRRNTPLPGQAGVCVLYGRSVAFGSPFAGADQLAAGTNIDIVTGQGQFTYEVDGVRRSGDLLPEPLAEGESRLTLVVGDSAFMPGLTAKSAYYVDATMIGKTVDAPVGRPTTIAADEDVLAGDKSGLVPLVLWLQALLLAALALVWARVRWGGWQTWVVGLPVVLGLLWGITSSAFVLLPNLL